MQFWCSLILEMRLEHVSVSLHISSYSYGFGDKLERKGPQKSNSEIHIFLSNFNAFLKTIIIIFMGY